MTRDRIGIIGFGNIGSVIYERTRSTHEVNVFEREQSKATGITLACDIADVVERSDTVVLAVKPQDYDGVLHQIGPRAQGKLIISLAAGVPTSRVEDHLGEVAVVRAMPNMPARIGMAMTALAAGRYVQDEDLRSAEALFALLGKSIVLREDLMDAATATSGSGPAFYSYIVEYRSDAADRFVAELADACESVGFTREDSLLLATTTAEGTDRLLRDTGLPHEDLRRQVATKGGTAEAGLRALEAGGTVKDAVVAALARGRELARSV